MVSQLVLLGLGFSPVEVVELIAVAKEQILVLFRIKVKVAI